MVEIDDYKQYLEYKLQNGLQLINTIAVHFE
jgi:hypothetical protein